MTKYKAMAFDLDGTLTDSEKRVTEKTKDAVTRAIKAGIFPILASGRTPVGIWPIAKALGLDKNGGYILAYNGGEIIDAKTGEAVVKSSVPMELLPEIYDFFQDCFDRYHTANYTFIGDELVADRPEGEQVQLEAKITGMAIRKVDSMKECIGIEVPKCMVTGDPVLLEEIEKQAREQFSGRLTITRSDSTFLEFLPLGADKAEALEHFIGSLGIKREELMAFGDGYNDLSMIRYAGMGVCMANGKEEVKAAADFITLSNNEDGVAYAIDKLIFGK